MFRLQATPAGHRIKDGTACGALRPPEPSDSLPVRPCTGRAVLLSCGALLLNTASILSS